MRFTRSKNDHGIALVTVLMMLTLISAMLVATTALVVKDQRARFQDTNRTNTFYVAHAGLEKITNDLGRAFAINYAPSNAELANVTATPPALGNMKFEIPGGGARSGYTITKGPTVPQVITTGSFAGLQGLITPYVINVTAQSQAGSESSLRRTVNTIAIPVFQFGIFSETDLSFFPGPNFNFGGRVHTNGNLFLAKDDNGNSLILGDYVTVYKDVIRQKMANGKDTEDENYDGIVKIAKTDGGCSDWNAATCRQIALTEGSLNENGSFNTGWETVSRSHYNGFIKNGANGDTTRPVGAKATGANRLVLPITSGGAPAIALIRRPGANENTANPDLFDQRYYSLASIRILLSDRDTDLNTLAGKGPGNAQNLQASWNKTAQAGTGLAAGGTVPWANWPYTLNNGAPLVDGWIKIEMQDQDGGDWTDVTTEILNFGYTGATLNPTSGAGYCAGDATAIIRLQRFKDNASNCTARTNIWSNTLYDAREGATRDDNPTSGTGSSRIYLGGVVHYVELDIANLRTWLASKRLTNSIMETTGYVVYFSDRRGNHLVENGAETGEYGYEDVVFPNTGTLNTGEDVNGSGATEIYGGRTFPSVVGASARGPFVGTALVSGNFETIDPAGADIYPAEQVARASRPIFFRRALKLVNGNRNNMLIDTPVTADRPRLGLTVVAENPVYIQGDYNATTAEGLPATYNNAHVGCAVIADAVTLLSNAWSDLNSFQNPHAPGNRVGSTTTYRTAIVSGKGLAFPWVTGTPRDFGTDGGTHNFLRYLEAGTRTLNYRGSIVSLYYNHQATGTYKCCNNVYGPPDRQYFFDNDFLTPSLLPPRTPMFRTIDVTSFSRLSEPPTP